VEPPLTTLKQPSREIGHEAVRIILDMIAGKAASDVIFEPKLVVRGSTSPPAR
jgi:DNA-binding LacI/PurR family transcriptional regulator